MGDMTEEDQDKRRQEIIMQKREKLKGPTNNPIVPPFLEYPEYYKGTCAQDLNENICRLVNNAFKHKMYKWIVERLDEADVQGW